MQDSCEDLTLFALAVGILGGVESGRIGHLAEHVIQDLLCDGAEELVAGDRLTSGRSQDPGVEVDVCLAAPNSCELSYSILSEWCTQWTNQKGGADGASCVDVCSKMGGGRRSCPDSGLGRRDCP
jgi:hypothetical protein